MFSSIPSGSCIGQSTFKYIVNVARKVKWCDKKQRAADLTMCALAKCAFECTVDTRRDCTLRCSVSTYIMCDYAIWNRGLCERCISVCSCCWKSIKSWNRLSQRMFMRLVFFFSFNFISSKTTFTFVSRIYLSVFVAIAVVIVFFFSFGNFRSRLNWSS